MAVKVCSARIDERGKAYGGQAGDQTGGEVSSQNWYLHSKGWRVFRAKDAAQAEKIAQCMERAAKNNRIGYDQHQRNTLYTEAKKVGFDTAKVTKACETDCSALVRVCCAYAGIMGLPADFRTGNMPANLNKTGAFTELTGSKYTTLADYLRRGDILVTRTSGHTVVVLTDGGKAAQDAQAAEGLRRGDRGADVAAMQRALLIWRASMLPKYGADGDFGAETEAALRTFQAHAGMPVTGIYDAATKAALTAIGKPKVVKVTGGLVNVRSAPGTDAKILGVAHMGDTLEYQGQTQDAAGTPWHLVAYQGANAWISGKYSEIAG